MQAPVKETPSEQYKAEVGEEKTGYASSFQTTLSVLCGLGGPPSKRGLID